MTKAVKLMLEEELTKKYESLPSDEKKKLMEMIQDLLQAESSWTSLKDIISRLAQKEAKEQQNPLTGRRPSQFGSAKGKIKIADNFTNPRRDAPLDDFAEYQ